MSHLDEAREPGIAKATAVHGAVSHDFVDHYQVLNLEPGASRVEVREAYLRLKSTYSAGSAALYSLISDEDAQAQMALIDVAFRVLGDEVARREYDRRFAHLLGIDSSAVQDERSDKSPLESSSLAPDLVSADIPAAERLMRAREIAGGSSTWDSAASEPVNDQSVVRTTRSTLPVIKLKASRVGGPDLEVQYAAMIQESDPADGDLYRRMREAAEVSEDELQERTKVSIGYVRAIEANRFDRLPQAVYVKGFLRSYFRYLGVPDAETLVMAFSERLSTWQANRKS